MHIYPSICGMFKGVDVSLLYVSNIPQRKLEGVASRHRCVIGEERVCVRLKESECVCVIEGVSVCVCLKE